MRPNSCNSSDYNLALRLYESVEEKNLHEIITLLEKDQANPNFILQDKGICTFHLVVGSHSVSFAEEVTKLFLQYNADPNIRSDEGLTPVHVAAAWGRTDILYLLLLCGGDPFIRDIEDNHTPLHFALREQHWEAALLIQRHQLLCRRWQRSDANIVQRYCWDFEKVIVNNGEVEAEYCTAPSAVQMSPAKNSAQTCKAVVSDDWNIRPLQTQDYVQHWCNKEFSVRPVTSTPFGHHRQNKFLTDITDMKYDQDLHETFPSNNSTANAVEKDEPDSQSKLHNNYSCESTMPVGSCKQNLVKPTTDVRKKLVLELKKRFNGFKQGFDIGKKNQKKNGADKQGKFPFLNKKRKKSISAKETENDYGRNEIASDDDCGDVFEVTTDSVLGQKEETDGHDEADALPVDQSVEWVASQSCFSNQLCSSPDSTISQLYYTCDEGSVASRCISSPPPLPLSPPPSTPLPIKEEDEEVIFKVPERPPRKKELTFHNNSNKAGSFLTQSSGSFGTVTSEEYRYTDKDKGVVLLEKHLFRNPVEVPASDCESAASSDVSTAVSEVSSVPASFNYDSDNLRKELIKYGDDVGPITNTTKRVYLRRLYRLIKKSTPVQNIASLCSYSPVLQHLFSSSDWETQVLTYNALEEAMKKPFENPDPSRRWREGLTKSSFNYILMDPRVSCNLPANCKTYDRSTWEQFISAIFYVGKGKRSRPYSHLYESVKIWNKGSTESSNAKVKKILEIWRAGYGVICLHMYQNIIPVEAFTREAAMLDALGLSNVVNIKQGEYYGPAATWHMRKKQRLGSVLLYKAMLIYLNEGERQLRPADID